MTTRFRPATIVRESLLNAVAYRILALAQIVLATVIGALVVAWTIDDVHHRETAWQSWIEAGGLVSVVNLQSPSAEFTAAACDSLRSSNQVSSAGAIVNTRSITPISQPTTSYPVDFVTDGYLSIMWPDIQHSGSPGIYVGQQMADNLGLRAGSTLAIIDTDTGQRGLVPVIDVLPPSTRDDGLARRAFSTTNSAGPINRCFVEIVSSYREAAQPAIIAGLPPAVSPQVTPMHTAEPPESSLHDRTSSLAWGLGATILSVFTCVVWFVRRSDFALFQLLGLDKPGILLAASTEVLGLVAAPAAAGILVAVVLAHDRITPLVAENAIFDGGRLLLAIALLPLLILAVASRRRVLDRLKGN